MKCYIARWCNGTTHKVPAYNGDDAWRKLVKWADQNHIQNPTQFTMIRER